MDWLTYTNQGAVRNLPLSPELVKALAFVEDMGLGIEVFSGGQPPKGSGLPRVGEVRHDNGNAADIFLTRNGERLTWENPEHLPIFEEFVRRGVASGLTGFGAGSGYMRPGSMHVGFGTPIVWGREGRRRYAPDWLVSAYYGADRPATAYAANDVSTGGVRTAVGGAGEDRMQGILGQFERTPEQTGGLLGLFGVSPERADQIRASIGGMHGINNPGMVAAARDRMATRADRADEDRRMRIQAAMQEAEAARAAEEQSRQVRFVEGLVGQGLLPPQVLELAQVDPVGAMRAAQTAITAQNDPNVQSSSMLPDQSGTVLTMRDGSVQVVTVGGETLSGQSALDYVRSAQDAYTEQQRSINEARTTGTLEARIDLGGEAAAAEKEGKMAPITAKEFGISAGIIASSISNIDRAIDAIDRGANSGVVYNMLPKLDEASADLYVAMNRLGLDVIGSVTFGALNAEELRLALETAAPRGLGPAELRDWLVRQRAAQTKVREALLEAALHFASGGTQAEYYEMIRYNQDESRPEGYPESLWNRVDPANRPMARQIWNDMTPEERQEFLGQ